MTSVLDINELTVRYSDKNNPALLAVNSLSLSVSPGEIVGVVGESGSGKSTLGSAIMNLLPGNADIAHGEILWRGENTLTMSERRLREIRGAEIYMVFQDPFTTLNPAYTIGTQLVDAQRAHRKDISKRVLRERTTAMLRDVGIPDSNDRFDMYPHQFSGGMRQRIAIAGALLLEPSLIVADEPTSALDVTLEAQIIELLTSLRDRLGTAVILISHDLGVIAEACDRVAVLYAGFLVEESPVAELFSQPNHPYTKALLAATPSVSARGRSLAAIPGLVPHITETNRGCVFADRCTAARATCSVASPRRVLDGQRSVLCHIYDESSAYHTDLKLEGQATRKPETV